MRRICLLTACLLLAAGTAQSQSKNKFPDAPSAKGVALTPEAWGKVEAKTIASADVDKLLADYQSKDKITPAPLVSDEMFLRRVRLDLTGKLPTPSEAKAFVEDSAKDKRAKLIDKLLDSDEFARHLARYWRDVIQARATQTQFFVVGPRSQGLETWLFEQFKANKSWSETARAMITAEGKLDVEKPGDNGALGFALCHTGQDGPVERANDTARVFLGVNIQCAQCHNHPSDVWQRQQFHELAAYYGKMSDRIRINQETREITIEVVGQAGFRGEYRMPDLDNPRKSYPVKPIFFLTSKGPGSSSADADRRKALADAVTAKDNYYFHASFVNRVWTDLFGQGFAQPVDNLGPLQEAKYPDVLLTLAASFRAGDHDVKGLYRVILNTEAYQREARQADQAGKHLFFASTMPQRMRPEDLYEAVVAALGPIGGTGGRFAGPGGGMGRRGPFSPAAAFRRLFDFDPSTPADEVESSVPQALMLMNNPGIVGRMKATGDTVLAKILKDNAKDDDAAIQAIYQRTLGRKPSDREASVCRDHLKEAKNREEGFEDLLWALINSTEFQTRR